MKAPRIFISTGEASGDLLGADLATALLDANPNALLYGMGGQRMQQQSKLQLVQRSEAISVVGLFEVVRHLPAILGALKTVKRFLKTERPDVLVLIDFPGFNFRIAKYAKELGIKIVYYVSPQVWAWHASRIQTLKKLVDHVAVLFPFEEKLYQDAGVPATFVGHPITKIANPSLTKDAIYQKLRLDPKKPTIGLLPGSRQQEIKRLLPIMVASAQKIKHQLPTAQFVLPLASSLTRDFIQPYLNLDIRVVENDLYNTLSICNSAIVTSGTATLDVALLGVPMVIIYKMNALTCWLAKRIIKISHFGLCNIVAEEPVAKELLQAEVTPSAIANEMLCLLKDQYLQQQVIDKLAHIRARLGDGDASKQTANIVLTLTP